MLERLERANLFLIPLDHERRWYRYHHLFAEALLGLLSQLHPALVAELHQRASAWYEQHGFWNETIEHALAANDVPRAARLIERAAYYAISSVRHATLLRWVEALPEEQVRMRPRLCFISAWALIMAGSSRWETIEALLTLLIGIGSRGFHWFDATLIGYAVATIFATAAVTYKYAFWLARPPTGRYWRRSSRLFLSKESSLIPLAVLSAVHVWRRAANVRRTKARV